MTHCFMNVGQPSEPSGQINLLKMLIALLHEGCVNLNGPQKASYYRWSGHLGWQISHSPSSSSDVSFRAVVKSVSYLGRTTYEGG
jgi:hypothetical protein